MLWSRANIAFELELELKYNCRLFFPLLVGRNSGNSTKCGQRKPTGQRLGKQLNGWPRLVRGAERAASGSRARPQFQCRPQLPTMGRRRRRRRGALNCAPPPEADVVVVGREDTVVVVVVCHMQARSCFAIFLREALSRRRSTDGNAMELRLTIPAAAAGGAAANQLQAAGHLYVFSRLSLEEGPSSLPRRQSIHLSSGSSLLLARQGRSSCATQI